jgi:hypothetical protein
LFKVLSAPLSRHALPGLLTALVWAVLFCIPAAGKEEVGGLAGSRAFLEQVDRLEQEGELSLEEALLLRFQYVFAPSELPDEYKTPVFSPTRCATDLVRSYQSQRERLSLDLRNRLDGYLQMRPTRASHLSSNGNFQLNWETSGADAVPQIDENPQDGVPDFINNLAIYLEHSYTVQVLMMGFADPLATGGVYQVFFRDMQTYGYTSVAPGEPAGTIMVLHNDFEGFPENEDPDGPVWGAAKVSAAHEFKHASQYRGSQWSEGGWIELDAVWAEDLTYDQTNDFYSYLWGASPIRAPETSLDSGSTSTGSYEDCVLQTCMQEHLGIQSVVAVWERRAQFPGEWVLETYRRVVEDQGVSWPQFWATFTGWNYATDHRTLVGVGYYEAPAYPHGAMSAQAVFYPAELVGTLDHLSATFLGLTNLGQQDGSLVLELTGDGGQFPLAASILIQRTDGTALHEVFTTDSGPHTVSVALTDIAQAAVVVSNPDLSGNGRQFTLQAQLQLSQPQPQLVLPQGALALEMEAGQPGLLEAELANGGEPGSVLNFRASVWDRNPEVYLVSSPDKSVAGSSLSTVPAVYVSGQTLNLELSLTNGSTDEEWLKELELKVPVGVSVLAAGPFSGGSMGDMEWNGVTGDGATTGWFGESGGLGYGVIRQGETATATLELSIDSGFNGDLLLQGTLTGDQFGFDPHTISVNTTLVPSWSQLSLVHPEGSLAWPLGQPLDINWEEDGTLDSVAVELSRDGGDSWEQLGQVPAADQAFTWLAAGEPTTRGLFRLTGLPGAVKVAGESPITLFPPSPWVTSRQSTGQIDQGSLQLLPLDCLAPTLVGNYGAWLVVQADGLVPVQILPVELLVSALAPVSPSSARHPGLLGNYPNPFNPSTNIRFYLPSPGSAVLDILDLRGARVRTLAARSFASGENEVTWDGRDDRGRALPGGVYLVRLSATGHLSTRKLLLAK